MITQSELKELLHYNSETGFFTRQVSLHPRMKIGAAVGCSHNKGYIVVRINGVLYLTHRLAWLYAYGHFPLNQIDHINGIKDDNRLVNLRMATASENLMNVAIRVDNTSGFKGVSWQKHIKKWRARGRINGKDYHLGYFLTTKEASLAYQSFAKQHHGEFYNNAVINIALRFKTAVQAQSVAARNEHSVV